MPIRKTGLKRRATRPRSVMYRKKVYRRRGVRPVRPFSQGYVYVNRKMPLCVIKTDALAGSFSVQDDGAGTLVTLGTPAPSLGLPSGWYDLPFSMTFSMNQVAGYTEFAALFDEYKIANAKVRISPNTNIAQAATSQNIPYIEWISDHDDSVVPTVFAFREKMGIHTKYFNSTTNSTTLNLRPRPVSQVYATPTLGYSLASKSVWLDMNNTSVPHYAIKGVLRHVYSPGISSQSQITIDAQLGFGLKGIQ